MSIVIGFHIVRQRADVLKQHFYLAKISQIFGHRTNGHRGEREESTTVSETYFVHYELCKIRSSAGLTLCNAHRLTVESIVSTISAAIYTYSKFIHDECKRVGCHSHISSKSAFCRRITSRVSFAHLPSGKHFTDSITTTCNHQSPFRTPSHARSALTSHLPVRNNVLRADPLLQGPESDRRIMPCRDSFPRIA